MGQTSVGFNAECNPAFASFIEGKHLLFGRHIVKGGINFQCIEDSRVVVQKIFAPEIWWVEDPLPSRIIKAAGTNIYCHFTKHPMPGSISFLYEEGRMCLISFSLKITFKFTFPNNQNIPAETDKFFYLQLISLNIFLNFSSQKSFLVLGTVASWQPSCLCQKQP